MLIVCADPANGESELGSTLHFCFLYRISLKNQFEQNKEIARHELFAERRPTS